MIISDLTEAYDSWEAEKISLQSSSLIKLWTAVSTTTSIETDLGAGLFGKDNTPDALEVCRNLHSRMSPESIFGWNSENRISNHWWRTLCIWKTFW
jgi:hypothetical protein